MNVTALEFLVVRVLLGFLQQSSDRRDTGQTASQPETESETSHQQQHQQWPHQQQHQQDPQPQQHRPRKGKSIFLSLTTTPNTTLPLTNYEAAILCMSGSGSGSRLASDSGAIKTKLLSLSHLAPATYIQNEKLI